MNVASDQLVGYTAFCILPYILLFMFGGCGTFDTIRSLCYNPWSPVFHASPSICVFFVYYSYIYTPQCRCIYRVCMHLVFIQHFCFNTNTVIADKYG